MDFWGLFAGSGRLSKKPQINITTPLDISALQSFSFGYHSSLTLQSLGPKLPQANNHSGHLFIVRASIQTSRALLRLFVQTNEPVSLRKNLDHDCIVVVVRKICLCIWTNSITCTVYLKQAPFSPAPFHHRSFRCLLR